MAANRRGLQPFEQPPSPRLVQSVAYISLHETRGRPKLSAYRTIPSGSPSSDASRELTIHAFTRRSGHQALREMCASRQSSMTLRQATETAPKRAAAQPAPSSIVAPQPTEVPVLERELAAAEGGRAWLRRASLWA